MAGDHSLDALLPPEMAAKAEQVGIAKAEMHATRLFVLAVLAGAFIALGANFANVVAAGTSGSWPYGVTRLLVGIVFSLGLVLVIVGGAELFTGNNLIVMAWAGGKVSTRQLLRNWGIVYVGNFVGAMGTAGLVYFSGQAEFGNEAIGITAVNTAAAKMQLGWLSAVVLGILCNSLVCLAVWLSFSARTTTDRVLVIVPPIAMFVAAGFEHCVANMYIISLGLFLSGNETGELSWSAFLWNNLLPVTVGNIIGGAVLVGVVYWFVYLRTPPRQHDQ